jgi:hypothetical protein
MVAAMNGTDDAPGREYLLETLDELVLELESGKEWENHTLSRYLDSFAALLGSIDNVYQTEGKPMPADPWVILAEVFRGARNYE